MDDETTPTRRPWRLPPVAGRGRWPFLVLWSALLLTCLVCWAMSLRAHVGQIRAPIPPSFALGFRISGETDAIWPTIGMSDRSVMRAGIRRGDRILAVHGRPVAADADGLNRQLDGPAGSTVTLTTISDGVIGRHVVTRDPDAYRRTLSAVGLDRTLLRSAFVVGEHLLSRLPLLACAILLMARRSRDALAPWASMMMLWLVLGDFSTGEWLFARLPDPTLAYHVTNAIAFSLQLIVLATFPTGRFEPRWSLAVAVLGTAATIVTEPMPNWIGGLALVVGQCLTVAAIVARYRRLPRGVGRQQIRWALLGFGMSLAMLAAFDLTLFAATRAETFGAMAWIELLGLVSYALSVSVLILSITVSLLRWRLYDADATISRSIVYGVVPLGLLAVFAGSEKLIEVMGEEYLGESLGALAGALGAAVAAVMVVPLHHRVTHWADKRFRGGLVRLRHGLPLLVGDMRETATAGQLADAMLARVEAGVRARHGAVVTDDGLLDARDVDRREVSAWLARRGLPDEAGATLRCDRSDPLFPMRVRLSADGVGSVGWLLLGSRPDGSFYGREERQSLREIAEPVARALAIALHRERREAERRREADDLRGQVEDLRLLVATRLKAGFGPQGGVGSPA